MSTEITKEQREALRAKWVAALRSGKYRQIRKSLGTTEGRCCLGVACEVFAETFPGRLQIDILPNGTIVYDGVRDLLPPSVCNAFGLNNLCGMFSEGNEGESLVNLNDKGISFDSIAGIIEARPVGLFVEEGGAS